jgi:hypothetical protein
LKAYRKITTGDVTARRPGPVCANQRLSEYGHDDDRTN